MCIPHGSGGKKDSGYIDIKPKKHVEKVSQEVFEKGDPNFVDERKNVYKKTEVKKSFLSSLLDD
ncbi:MAG: hypothetical protein PF437_03935 [Sulfurimonas sp.]|jgi:hypothetical protein|nr:hypothetical protein [Sulfurimonas sp.]